MGFNLLIGVACAMLFFRAAQYEKMSPWIWAIASFGLSAILTSLASGLLLLLIVQAGLFVVMTLYNAQRHSGSKK